MEKDNIDKFYNEIIRFEVGFINHELSENNFSLRHEYTVNDCLILLDENGNYNISEFENKLSNLQQKMIAEIKDNLYNGIKECAKLEYLETEKKRLLESKKNIEGYERILVLYYENYINHKGNYKFKPPITLNQIDKILEEYVNNSPCIITFENNFSITMPDPLIWQPPSQDQYLQYLKIKIQYIEKAISIIDDLKDDLLTTSENLKTSKPIQTGFQSNLTDIQIESLYNKMQGTYIDTTIDNFKAIFKNELLPQNFIPIKKTQKFSNVLLAYFIKKLFHAQNPFDVWVKAEKIFATKNLRQSENNPFPKGYNNIDTILKNIYTPLQ